MDANMVLWEKHLLGLEPLARDSFRREGVGGGGGGERECNR